MVHFIPFKKAIDATEAATLIFTHVVCLHGVSLNIVSDCDVNLQATFGGLYGSFCLVI